MNYPGSPSGKVLALFFAGAILFGASGTWICQHLLVQGQTQAAGTSQTIAVSLGENPTSSPIPWRQGPDSYPATTREDARRQAAESLNTAPAPTAIAANNASSRPAPTRRHGGHPKPPPPPELLQIWKNCGLFTGQGSKSAGEALAAPAPILRRLPVSERVLLIGVIDDRAILKLPVFTDESRPGPSNITVCAGDTVGAITVVAVNPDSVELDEAGKKYVKYLQVRH